MTGIALSFKDPSPTPPKKLGLKCLVVVVKIIKVIQKLKNYLNIIYTT